MIYAEPVAIVGRGCVLPGCMTVDALWESIAAGRNLLAAAPVQQWGEARVEQSDRHCVAGFITGFDQVFDPARHSMKGIDVKQLDPVVQWPLHAVKDAWDDAGRPRMDAARKGVVMANLSYPSRSKADYCSDCWLDGKSAVLPLNAFNSGLPALLIARALGATGAAFALDAACASSLYAVQIACRKLQLRHLDAAVVCAVNAADGMMLLRGFDALQALSPSGRSQPFAAAADGLVPAQGAAALVLKRLCDVRSDEPVHGVIRSVGLSNDGRRGGFLVPDGNGQLEAMRRAYAAAGIAPDSIGYLECHATGTPVGDAVEIHSASELFGERNDALPAGSLKSNIGHLITVAGLASMLKLTLAMERETLPPTRLEGALNDALSGSCLQPQQACALWPDAMPRRAAISNFGFGGNNAHLILEQYRTNTRSSLHASTSASISTSSSSSTRSSTSVPENLQANAASDDPVVICGIGALAGPDRGIDRIVRRLMSPPEQHLGCCESIAVDPLRIRTPPDDLRHAEAQQLALIAVVDEAWRHAGLHRYTLDDVALSSGTPSNTALCADRIGVYAGTGCANDATRWLLRERLAERLNEDPLSPQIVALQESIVAPLCAADVLGAMPNMSANRINAAYDCRAQGYTVSAEGVSGLVALQLGCDALLSNDIDAALVAVADFASEPLRTRALKACAQPEPTTDIACCLVLMRMSRARELGVKILATCTPPSIPATAKDVAQNHADDVENNLINRVYGSAPIADTVFEMAVAMALAARGQRMGKGQTEPALCGRQDLTFSAWSGFAISQDRPMHVSLHVSESQASPDPVRPVPHIFWACAATALQLWHQVRERQLGGQGSWRLVIVAQDHQHIESLFERACTILSNLSDDGIDGAMAAERLSREQLDDGLYIGFGVPDGELAFVYTGSAAAYPRMGRGLLMALPELAAQTEEAFPESGSIARLLSQSTLNAYQQLCAVTLLSQAHTLLLRDLLGLSPDAALGLSLGETNAIVAFGFWHDAAGLLEEIAADGMYEQHLGGRFDTAARAWGSSTPVQWQNWRVYASIDTVQQGIARTRHSDITIIYSHEDCVIGGPAEECAELVRSLEGGHGVLMNQHLIVHSRTLQPYAATWQELHTRPTTAHSNVRVYSHADHESYQPTRESIADRLTRQALHTIDFRKVVERAYADGVRTFVEIGPADTLTRSIGKILGSRAHLAMAADRIEQSDIGQIAHLVAALFAEGRDVKLPYLIKSLDAIRANAWRLHSPAPTDLMVPAHFAQPVLSHAACTGPPATDSTQSTRLPTMPAAPPLAMPDYGKTHTSVIAGKTPATVTTVGTGIALTQCPPVGSAFERDALVQSTTGSISHLFGQLFRQQDHYVRQVRLPAPPLLLVDRILGIDAQPGTANVGRIWTETDVVADNWYLHAGVMRPGPLIEAGQADLSLISWMGADFRNQDERVYRLLGCELTLHGDEMPSPGDTLRYQIEITGHACVSGVHLFFFQYDCHSGDRLLISVRNGQAGFFTIAELASGAGVLTDLTPDAPASVAPESLASLCVSDKRSFDRADLDALRQGDAYACFGRGFEACAAHSRTPRLPAGRLALLDEVVEFAPTGGTWGHGYLKAISDVPVDAWFYAGHFHNDPCMPGTLMAEAAVQALECFALAIGLGIARDGWLFEPVPEVSARFECRGQVVPNAAHRISYEVFVSHIIDGDMPEVHAALLASSDGHKVFHCPRFAIRLRRHWPSVSDVWSPIFIGPQRETRGDAQALQACGNGAPSAAFGEMYRTFDHSGRVPRLPQPPYHMISRVLSVSTRPNHAEDGARTVTEFDVDKNAWYFADNRNGCMPLAVLIEIVLQPCGWLASHSGFALLGGECFRNLDGDGQVLCAVQPAAGCVRVDVIMTRHSTVGSMSIVHFELSAVLADGSPVMTLETSFGFFPMDALARQTGLPISDVQRTQRNLPVQLHPIKDVQYLLPAGRLQMLDEVDYFDSRGGSAGLGLIRAQQQVDPYAWYFKAHFFQDPVQPGSLGVDVLQQTLLRAILLKGLLASMPEPQIESPANDQALRWLFRGQVTPMSKCITLIVEITNITTERTGVLVVASGHLWCDELRIYEVDNLSIRLLDNG